MSIIDAAAEQVADLAMTIKGSLDLSNSADREKFLVNELMKSESLREGDDLTKMGVKFDEGKARYDLIPPEGPRGVAAVLEYGARKYAARNWEQGMEWSRPFAAIHRHLASWWEGEDCDPDTGYSHLWHVATNVFFLIAFEARGKGTDDRPKDV